MTKKLALKYFQRALSLYQHAQQEKAKMQAKPPSGPHDERVDPLPVHYSDEHVSLLLEISKVYKIMSLLQPDADESLTKSFGNL